MNLLIDESVDRQVVEKLRLEGHDVVYVSDLDPGISDDVVLSTANKMRALLVTADKDFGELVFRRQDQRWCLADPAGRASPAEQSRISRGRCARSL